MRHLGVLKERNANVSSNFLVCYIHGKRKGGNQPFWREEDESISGVWSRFIWNWPGSLWEGQLARWVGWKGDWLGSTSPVTSCPKTGDRPKSLSPAQPQKCARAMSENLVLAPSALWLLAEVPQAREDRGSAFPCADCAAPVKGPVLLHL